MIALFLSFEQPRLLAALPLGRAGQGRAPAAACMLSRAVHGTPAAHCTLWPPPHAAGFTATWQPRALLRNVPLCSMDHFVTCKHPKVPQIQHSELNASPHCVVYSLLREGTTPARGPGHTQAFTSGHSFPSFLFYALSIASPSPQCSLNLTLSFHCRCSQPGCCNTRPN